MNENAIGTIVVDCAVELHRNLEPGLLETVYEVTLARALERRGVSVRGQVGFDIEYRGEKFDEGFRADLGQRGVSPGEPEIIAEISYSPGLTPFLDDPLS
jgi:hypothetical protein